MPIDVPQHQLDRLAWRSPWLEAPTARFYQPSGPHLVTIYAPELVPDVVDRDPDGSAKLANVHRPGALAGWAMDFPTWERNPLPMNRNGARGGWCEKAGQVRVVRETARLLALGDIPPQERIRVRLDWHVVDRRDRDEDNLVACMKALVDGIRLAGVVPKDTREYVLRDMPRIDYAPRSPDRPHASMRLWISSGVSAIAP